MSKGAGEADVKLLFGADEASLGKISNDIESMLSQLDSKNFKIKFGADLTRAKKDAESFAKSIRTVTENAMSSAGSIKMPAGKVDVSATKNVASDMSKIAADSAKATANVIKMSGALSSNNAAKINEAFNSKEISVSSENVENIVRRLSEANVVLEKAKVNTSQLVDKEQKLVSLKLKGKNADNDSVEYLVKFNKKTGEIKEILSGITVEMEKQNNASSKSKQQVVSDNKQKTASYDQLRDAYKRAMSVANSNTAASGLQSYIDLSARLTSAEKIIETVELKWNSLSEEEQAATSKAEIFADVLLQSSSSAASVVDGLKNNIRDLQTEMNLTGVSGKQVDLGAAVSNAEDYLSSNQIFKEEAEYTTLQNLVNQYGAAVKKAKDESMSLDEALSGMGMTGAEAAKELTSAMDSLVNKIKFVRDEAKVKKDYSNTTKNLQNVVDNWTKAKNSLKNGSSEAYNAISNELTNLNDVWARYSNGAASIGELKRAVASANDVYAQNSKIIKSNGDATQTWGQKISSLASKFKNWFGASQLVLKGIETVKKMVSAVIELDTAMTELKKVTDEAEATYDAFLDRAESRAKQLGSSLSDTVTATADFARLGFKIEDAEKLADSAIVYKNVGDGIANISEASESIISTMQAFGVEADDVMTIVDKFNEVGNNYAISSKGVGDAMLRSASAMKAAGNTIDETIGLITAANEVVQSPEKVGTALKSISMFLRAAKTEAEDAGESTEGMAKSVSELRSEILALTGGKVDIQIDEDTFKSTVQILRELSQVWAELTDISKANILEMIGGKRNSNITSALIKNFDTVEKVIETSAGAAGSAMAENEKVLDSIQGKINVFKAAFEALSNSVISGDLVKTIVSIGTALLNGTNAVIRFANSFGGLKTVLVAVIGLNMSSIISGITSAFSKLQGVIDSVSLKIAFFKEGFNKVRNEGGRFLKSFAAGLSSANLWITAITVIATAVTAGIERWKYQQEEIRKEALEAVDAYRQQETELKNNKSTLDEISEKYAELSKGVDTFGKNRNLSTDEYEEYKDIVGQIAEMLPDTIKGYNDEGVAILSLKGTVDELTEAYNQLIIAKSNEVLDKTPELFKDFERKRKEYEPKTFSSPTWGSNWKASDGLTKKTVDALKKIISSNDIENAIVQYANQNSENSQRILYALREKGLRSNGESDNQFLARAVREYKNIVNSLITEAESEVQSSVSKLQSDASAYIAGALADAYSKIPNEIKDILKQMPTFMDSDFFSSFGGSTDAYYNYLNDLLAKFSKLNSEDQNTIKIGFDLQTRFNNGECSVGELLSWINTINGVLAQFDEKTRQVLVPMFNIDVPDIKNQYDKVLAALGEKNQNWLKSLKSDDLEILYNISVKEDTSGWTLDKWKEKLNSYKLGALQDATDIKQAFTDVKNVIDGISNIQSVIDGQKSGISLDLETLNSDDLLEYKDALELVNGAVQLNTDKVDEIVRKKADEQAAIINTNKALEQSKYIENARQIEQYRQKLEATSFENGETADSIKTSIDALLDENSAIADNCDQYDMLTIALKEATGAYQHWINAQSSSDYGDMANGTVGAINQISNTYDPDSDFYGNFGSKKFQAAVDLVIPDSVDQSDLNAVESYMNNLKQYLKFDKDGNADGLDVDKFLSNAVKAGLVKYSEDTGFEVAGEKSVEDFAKGLNMSEDMVRSFFDELQLKGASFDWSADWSNGEKTIGDLYVDATEAAEALRKLDNNGGWHIKLDVSDLNDPQEQITSLETTISNMQRLKTKINVSSEEIEHANTIIAYCLKQKQLLSQPDVMRVDTSKVEGGIGDAISLLQKFQESQSQLEIEVATGVDTSDTQKQIDGLLTKIQSLSPELKTELSLNTTSVDSIKDSIKNITAEALTVDAKIDASAIEGYNPESKTCDVIYDPNTDLLPKSFGDMHCNVIYDAVTKDLPTKLTTLTRWVHYKAYGDTQEGDHAVNGTAHINGTAMAGGNWGTATGGKTLVGELGREIVVNPHTGRWYTVGDHGAEFVTIPQGAIIFNHLQSESLLENGYVAGRGAAMVSGTARSYDVKFTYKPWEKPLYTENTGEKKSVSSKTSVASTGNTERTSGGIKSNETDSNAESEFEKQYKRHQHLVAMEKESQSKYLKWLASAYKDAYAKNQITLDDYRKYEEEVYEGNKKLIEDSFDKELNLQKHKVAMGTKAESAYYTWLESRIKSAYKTGAITIDEYRSFLEEIKQYEDQKKKEDFQSKVDTHEYRRDMGLESDAEYLKWLTDNNLAAYKDGKIDKSQYRDNKKTRLQLSRDIFKDKINDRDFQIEQLSREDGNDDEIIELRNKNIEDINRRIEKAYAYGLDENDDWVQELMSMRNTQQDAIKDINRSLYDKEIKEHEHMVAMGQETEEEYFKWFGEHSKKAFEDGIIDQDEYWSNLESQQDKHRELFNDKIGDQNFQIEQMSRTDGNEKAISDLYKENIKDIENELADARARGLDENNEWVQQLIISLNDANDGAKQVARSLYDKELEEHKHNVAIGKETEEEYFKWFKNRNEEVFAEGIIDKSEYWTNIESLYGQRQNLFKDSLGDRESKISNLEANEADVSEVVAIYNEGIEDIKREIDAAYAYGLDENDDYVQYLTGKLNDYKKNVKSTTDDITNDAKSAMDTLASYQEDIIKQNLKNQKEALQDRLEATKKYYDKRKEYLQDQYDQETYLKDQNEKRKDVIDIENRLRQLENDDSAWASKRRLELQAELQEARDNLEEFERKKNLDTVIDAIDDLYEKESELVQKQIDSIDATLNNPQAIYNKALLAVRSNTSGIYAQMIEYNRRYGSGNDADVDKTYNDAKDALDKYEKYYGEGYSGSSSYDLSDVATGVVNLFKDAYSKAKKGNISGYAKGTSNATAGLHRLYEEGYEQIFSSKDGKHYRMLNAGDMVLDADKTRFLFDFAKSKGSIFANLIHGSLGNEQRSINNNRMQNIDINTGDIVINGNTDNDTVSKIRRDQRSQVDFMLRELKKLNNR